MLSPCYLDSLNFVPFEGLEGKVFVVSHHLSGWRYFCTYSDGKASKDHIFHLLRTHGQQEIPSEWDFHHVVEGNHLADVDFDGSLSVKYEHQLPCVLIHRREEHELYSRLFRLRAARDLFRNGTGGNQRQRAAEARNIYSQAGGRPALMNRMNNLAIMYQQAYAGDPVLQCVAKNVFTVIRNNLR